MSLSTAPFSRTEADNKYEPLVVGGLPPSGISFESEHKTAAVFSRIQEEIESLCPEVDKSWDFTRCLEVDDKFELSVGKTPSTGLSVDYEIEFESKAQRLF